MKVIADFPTTSTNPLPPDSYSFDYTIGVTLWLTRADIDLLILCAKHHYDGVCQEFGLARDKTSSRGDGRAGRTGKLVILRDAYLATDGERTPASLTQQEIGTMLKILEVVHHVRYIAQPGGGVDLDHADSLNRRLREVFHAINRESSRLRAASQDQPFSKELHPIFSSRPDDGRHSGPP